MKLANSLLAVTVVIASLGFAASVKADTVNARCDVFPKGGDRAVFSGPCTFSQRQGIVGIQLQNGKRYDLIPVGNNPGNYRDQNGRAGYRQDGLGDRGQIYRLTNESVFVYWDRASSEQSSGNTMAESSTARSQPAAGTTVSRLRDLVGARAGQAENAIRQRGYRFVRTDSPSGDAVYSYWLEDRTNYCVTIRTEQGRYQSIAYTGGSADCNHSANTTGGSTSSRQPTVGTTVAPLRDLVGARAGQAENVIRQRGYRFVKADDGGYSYWLEGRTNYCVTIRTDEGRYQSIVYTGGSADCQQ
jgi:hypothetical protein